MRGAHAARSAAAAAAARPPRARYWRGSCRCDLAGARLTPLGVSVSPETAPGGLGAARRWPTVPPGPAGAAAAPLMCCRDRLSAYDVYGAYYVLFRDCARSCGRYAYVQWFQSVPMFVL